MTDTKDTRGRIGTVTVLGARGMLGSDLVPALVRTGCTVRALDLPECDVTRQTDLRSALRGADVAINCAAYTDVDGAESHRDAARAVNADAPGTLAALAAESGTYIIHISTDFVFDGQLDRPYREDDPPNPINVYGETKRQGEINLLAAAPASAVVRVQWTYGSHGNHFVSKFLARAQAGDELLMVDDQIGAPTWTRDVADALVALSALRPAGILHLAADGYATRFDVAREILNATGLTGKQLRPCKTADFAAPAARPLNSRFDCTRVDSLLKEPRPHWRDSLHAFLRCGHDNVT